MGATRHRADADMRCPKDANHRDQNNEKHIWCPKVDPGYNWKCTRKNGHQGKHHSHNSNNRCVCIWE